jgi:hypothetical protein
MSIPTDSPSHSPQEVSSTTIRDLAPGRHPVSLGLRVRTARHGSAITRALAQGADPTGSDELALRARQLTTPRRRGALARNLRRTIAEAHDPRTVLTSAAIVDRRGVRDAEDAITALLTRLGSPRPVQAQGMAMIERLLTNADDESPLYSRGVPGTLQRMIHAATAALDPARSQTHEFPLGG